MNGKYKKNIVDDHIKSVEEFIFNDDVQNLLSKINENVMDFNIFEITGMGHQEIKHSNVLSWLFSDSEHKLKYQILDNFLKKIITKNKTKNEIINRLQSYIYLPRHNREITIYREKYNIDLLIIDNANKVVIVVENKVYASERIEGEDGGQLRKYEDIIAQKFSHYVKYFIFLTVDLEEPSEEKWLKGNYQMISDSIEDELKTKEISPKSKIILESYIDLLKRRAIVEDKKLKELCMKIWDNKKYKNAFEIILSNRPNKADDILKWIKESTLPLEHDKTITMGNVYNFFIKSKNGHCLLLRIIYNPNKGINYVLVTKKQNINVQGQEHFNNLSFNNKYGTNTPEKQFNYYILSKFSGYMINDEEINEDIIGELLKKFSSYIKNFKGCN